MRDERKVARGGSLLLPFRNVQLAGLLTSLLEDLALTPGATPGQIIPKDLFG